MEKELMPYLRPFYNKVLRTSTILETPENGYCLAISIPEFNRFIVQLRLNLIDYYSGTLNNVVMYFRQKILKDKLYQSLLKKEQDKLNVQFDQIKKDSQNFVESSISQKGAQLIFQNEKLFRELNYLKYDGEIEEKRHIKDL